MYVVVLCCLFFMHDLLFVFMCCVGLLAISEVPDFKYLNFEVPGRKGSTYIIVS